MSASILILAAAMALPTPAPVEGPFSEVSTNIPLRVNLERLQSLSFELALDASPSNNLEVAIGCDANHDGILQLLEADYTFGYDCGRWFIAETRSGGVSFPAGEPTGEGENSRVFSFSKHIFSANWDLLKVTRRGSGELNETLTSTEDHIRFMIRIR